MLLSHSQLWLESCERDFTLRPVSASTCLPIPTSLCERHARANVFGLSLRHLTTSTSFHSLKTNLDDEKNPTYFNTVERKKSCETAMQSFCLPKPTKVSTKRCLQNYKSVFQIQHLRSTAGEYREKGKVNKKMRVERALQMRRCDLDVLGGDPVHTHLINSRLGPPDSFDVQ